MRSESVVQRRIKSCKFFWGHFTSSAAGPSRRTDFARAVLADGSALDVAKVADLLFRIRGWLGDKCVDEYRADTRQMLRLRSMLRRERDEGAQQGDDAANPNSINVSARISWAVFLGIS